MAHSPIVLSTNAIIIANKPYTLTAKLYYYEILTTARLIMHV